MNENFNTGVPNPVEAGQLMQGLVVAVRKLIGLRQKMWTDELCPVAERKRFYGHGEEPVLTQLDALPTMKSTVAQYRELGRCLAGVRTLQSNLTLLNQTEWASFARSVVQYYGRT